MEIIKLRESCFKIKGKKATMLVDPTCELKNLRAHIVICASKNERSEFLFSSTTSEIKVKGEPVTIFGPGEYEIKQARIFGFREKGETVYKIEMDGLSILYLNRLPEKISEDKIERLGSVEILILPVSCGKAASFLVSQVDPLIVLPTRKEGLEEFLKEEEIEKVEKVSKLTITKEDLPEERRVVVLK